MEGSPTPVVQSIGSVAKATQGAGALLLPVPLQSPPVLLKMLVHQWRFVTGVPDEVLYVKFNDSEAPGLTRFFVDGGNSPENPVKVETVLPVVTAAALGSNATTQQEGVPLPPPFNGSRVTEGAVYEVKTLRLKAVFGQLTPCLPMNAGPPAPFGKLLASML